jgi:3-polyprenyl-4-hydroxybenzoate decarboxylase
MEIAANKSQNTSARKSNKTVVPKTVTTISAFSKLTQQEKIQRVAQVVFDEKSDEGPGMIQTLQSMRHPDERVQKLISAIIIFPSPLPRILSSMARSITSRW